jgi:hypothetical protein
VAKVKPVAKPAAKAKAAKTDDHDDDDDESEAETEESEAETEEDESEAETEEDESEAETEEDESETETDVETLDEGSLPKFNVMQRAVLRSGFEMGSAPAGGKPLKIGDVVQALETRLNEKGVLRVRIAQGWISAKAGDGTILLDKVAAEDEGSEAETDMEESDMETEEDTDLDSDEDDESDAPVKKKKKPAKKPAKTSLPSFTVAQRAVVRSGFAMTSAPAGGKPLKIGDTITALETKTNEKGVLRVRIGQGWVSETAGDGTVLLEKVGDDEDVSSEEETEYSDDESVETDASGQKTQRQLAKEEAAESSDDSVDTDPEEESRPMFKVKAKAVLRSGFEMDSKAAGGKPLKIGEIISALSVQVNDKGVTRIRCAAGWVSEKAGDGTILLEEYAEPETAKASRLKKLKLAKRKAKRLLIS